MGPKAEAGFINQRYLFATLRAFSLICHLHTHHLNHKYLKNDKSGVPIKSIMMVIMMMKILMKMVMMRMWITKKGDHPDDQKDHDDQDHDDQSTFPGNNRICRRRGRSQSDNQELPRHSSLTSSSSSSS